MSKLLPFLVAGVGASSVSVGGVFMLKKTGGSEEGAAKGDQGSSTPDTSKDLEFDSLDKFEKKGGACVKQLFGKEMNLSNATGNPADVTFSSIENTLNPISSATKDKNQSCLIINYEKKEGDSKGTGTFTWTWVFAHETKGFVVFGLAKTPNPPPSEKKMTIEGGFYILSKTGSEWSVTNKKEVKSSSNKNIEQSQLDNYFPKPENSLKGAEKSYGNFISGSSDFVNICSEASCTEKTVKKYKEQGSWQGKETGGDKNPHAWSDNMDWFKNIFDDTGDKLKTHLSSLSGTWDKKTTTSTV